MFERIISSLSLTNLIFNTSVSERGDVFWLFKQNLFIVEIHYVSFSKLISGA